MQPWPFAHLILTLGLFVIVPYLLYVYHAVRDTFKTHKATKASESEFVRRFREAQTLYKTR